MSDDGEWQGQVDRRLGGVERRLDGVEHELRAIKDYLTNNTFNLAPVVVTAANLCVSMAAERREHRERMDRIEAMLAEVLESQRRIEGFSAGRKKKNHRNG